MIPDLPARRVMGWAVCNRMKRDPAIRAFQVLHMPDHAQNRLCDLRADMVQKGQSPLFDKARLLDVFGPCPCRTRAMRKVLDWSHSQRQHSPAIHAPQGGLAVFLVFAHGF